MGSLYPIWILFPRASLWKENEIVAILMPRRFYWASALTMFLIAPLISSASCVSWAVSAIVVVFIFLIYSWTYPSAAIYPFTPPDCLTMKSIMSSSSLFWSLARVAVYVIWSTASLTSLIWSVSDEDPSSVLSFYSTCRRYVIVLSVGLVSGCIAAIASPVCLSAI